MDKRIIKTKNNIKQTLIEMLAEKKFEEITVKELCERAETSRITFYTHYSDKIELASEIFEDMSKKAHEEYHRLQDENNPDGDIVFDYLNILDCVLNTYYENYDFFAYTRSDVSPLLSNMYSNLIDEKIKIKIGKDRERLNPIYPMNLICAFICSGLKGFMNEARRLSMSDEEIRPMAREILKSMLENDVIRRG